MSGSLLDTSAVVALPDEIDASTGPAAVSVITVGELHAGVLRAADEHQRELRQERLEGVYALFDPIPVDAAVAARYGDVLAQARVEGRAEKPMDLLIIATAAATGRTLVTRDRRQAALARSMGLPVIEPR